MVAWVWERGVNSSLTETGAVSGDGGDGGDEGDGEEVDDEDDEVLVCFSSSFFSLSLSLSLSLFF